MLVCYIILQNLELQPYRTGYQLMILFSFMLQDERTLLKAVMNYVGYNCYSVGTVTLRNASDWAGSTG